MSAVDAPAKNTNAARAATSPFFSFNATSAHGSTANAGQMVFASVPVTSLPMGAASTTMSAMSRRMGAEATHPFVQRYANSAHTALNRLDTNAKYTLTWVILSSGAGSASTRGISWMYPL